MEKNKSFSKNIHPWSGRKCALCELSLTNKNNIIMKIVHQKYCPHHNDEDTKYIQISHIYCRTHFPVCIPRSVAVGGDQIMSYVAAKVFICFYRSCCSVPWSVAAAEDGTLCRAEDLSTFSRTICLTLQQDWKYIKLGDSEQRQGGGRQGARIEEE